MIVWRNFTLSLLRGHGCHASVYSAQQVFVDSDQDPVWFITISFRGSSTMYGAWSAKWRETAMSSIESQVHSTTSCPFTRTSSPADNLPLLVSDLDTNPWSDDDKAPSRMFLTSCPHCPSEIQLQCGWFWNCICHGFHTHHLHNICHSDPTSRLAAATTQKHQHRFFERFSSSTMITTLSSPQRKEPLVFTRLVH